MAVADVCDLATVAPERAAGLSRWAALRVKWPEPGRLHESIQLRVGDGLGLHAVSRCSFNTGDLVLKEDALLRIPDLPKASRMQLERRFGARAPFLSPALAVDWQGVSEEVRRATLDYFWAHPLMDAGRQDEVFTENLQACESIKQWSEPLRQRWDAYELLRFLHIVDLNIHRDDEEPQHNGFSGIFVVGSKFSHSCAPNCSWSFSEDGCLQYRAIRPIAPGELFNFSYIGNGMNLIVSTLSRRHRLASLWFTCQCSRCIGPDLARQMRCPKCSSTMCLPEYEVPDGMTTDWSSKHRLHELIPDANSWRCSSCGSTTAAAEMPLKTEEELSEIVPQVMQGSFETASEDAVALTRLRQKAASTVGTAHWTFVLASFAWLQKCYIMLRKDPLIQFSEADLQGVSTAVACWLEAAARQNTEQRFSALFIALRLAGNVGGRLQLWGYDPVEPLAGCLWAGARMAAHGWRPCEDGVEGPEEAGARRCRGGCPELSGERNSMAGPHSTRRFTGLWS